MVHWFWFAFHNNNCPCIPWQHTRHSQSNNSIQIGSYSRQDSQFIHLIHSTLSFNSVAGHYLIHIQLTIISTPYERLHDNQNLFSGTKLWSGLICELQFHLNFMINKVLDIHWISEGWISGRIIRCQCIE